MSTSKKPGFPFAISPELAEALSKHGKSLFGPPIQMSPELAKVMSAVGIRHPPGLSSLYSNASNNALNDSFVRKIAKEVGKAGIYRDQFGLLQIRPANQSPSRIAEVLKKKRGRRPGSGYQNSDRKLFPKIERLIADGEAQSPHGAAALLVSEIKGSGTPENRAKRLGDRYNEEKAKPS